MQKATKSGIDNNMLGLNCDFKLKTQNSDFRVAEVPLLPDMDSAPKKYTYLCLEKSNFTTFDALEKIMDFYGLAFDDLVAEGLKDEDGITQQLISVHKKLSKKSLKEFNQKYNSPDEFIRIELKGYGAEPLRAKALHGNAFTIIVRNLSLEEAEKIIAFGQKCHFFPFINYYDNQRFGLPGGPYTTHLIGKAIVEEKWDEAFEILKSSGNEIPEGKSGKDAFLALNPGRVGFYISAYNSYLWNNAVSDYIKEQGNSKACDFPGIGDLYLPQSMEISLPIGGLSAKGYRLDRESFEIHERMVSRSVFSATAIYANGLAKDEIFKDKYRVTLSFFLHTGSYATMIIKQYIKASLEEKDV